ncbi:MAG: class I SAM-dependent methyltransferase [Oscillospiraceae bacterium]
MNELLEFWKQEEAAAFSGWDFSYLTGRLRESPLPWNYEKWLREFLKPDTRLLDMGTGGGEFLLSLKHSPKCTSVTEAWEPNFRLCQKRLSPLGITVAFSEGAKPLPFADNSFDLVINRHEFYNLAEVKRVLKKGGHFITQQVGAENGMGLSRRLGLSYEAPNPCFNLENEAQHFKNEGFRVVRRDQAYPVDIFTDIGAVCYYAKRIPWEFPEFSVERCENQLLNLQKELLEKGNIRLQEHRFILVGKRL